MSGKGRIITTFGSDRASPPAFSVNGGRPSPASSAAARLALKASND